MSYPVTTSAVGVYQGPPAMSRVATEKSWEELRRESRQLENEIEAKLNSYSKLNSNYIHRDTGYVTMATMSPPHACIVHVLSSVGPIVYRLPVILATPTRRCPLR
jgi:hypothetical protein